jgi:hypothetical protein
VAKDAHCFTGIKVFIYAELNCDFSHVIFHSKKPIVIYQSRQSSGQGLCTRALHAYSGLPMAPEKRTNVAGMAAFAAITLLIVAGGYLLLQSGERQNSGLNAGTTQANAQGPPTTQTGTAAGGDSPSLNLSDSQLASVKVEPAAEREFPIEKESVGWRTSGNTYARTRLSNRLFTSYDISPLSGPCACFSRQRGPGPRM